MTSYEQKSQKYRCSPAFLQAWKFITTCACAWADWMLNYFKFVLLRFWQLICSLESGWWLGFYRFLGFCWWEGSNWCPGSGSWLRSDRRQKSVWPLNWTDVVGLVGCLGPTNSWGPLDGRSLQMAKALVSLTSCGSFTHTRARTHTHTHTHTYTHIHARAHASIRLSVYPSISVYLNLSISVCLLSPPPPPSPRMYVFECVCVHARESCWFSRNSTNGRHWTKSTLTCYWTCDLLSRSGGDLGDERVKLIN